MNLKINGCGAIFAVFQKRFNTFKTLFVLLLFVLLGYYLIPEPKISKNIQIDHLILYKSKRQLLAFSNEKLIKTYKVSLGKQPIGAKAYEGDLKTPEGHYTIFDKNPNSGYHKNLGISYPNSKDIQKAKHLGKPVGGAIKIHGIRNHFGLIGKFHRWFDWTLGCVALTNQEVDELYDAVKIGTPIDIMP
ncbi:L,D-transpeptidase family protein [Flavobacterium branchiophilum]|uniref:L,D-TPase catalytic domain-containing protein n=1 Tax=Flavobacterium branchiophilum (strain FL-15) TaxID=1034807 RepID=G2Z3N9_FLABF|nr:L,D-transpeptidase family protein [Flavobacterium branchiophilum]CCB70495.1 Protein of unknown function [Flavobacterium branchiophilum FL-15]